MPSDASTATSREPGLASVIVRTVGRPSLARALDSIAAQSHRPLEIVLVDAAAAGIAMDAHRGIPVRVVLKGRLARAAAANAGLEAAGGEWIAFLDEDDEWLPEHVAQVLAAARSAGARAAYSQTLLVDAAGRAQRVLGGPFARALLLNSNYLSIHSVLFHRSFVDEGRRFDTTLPMFEDWDFWLALSEHAGFAFTGRATAIYHASSGQSGAGAGPNLDRDRALAVRDRLMARWRH